MINDWISTPIVALVLGAIALVGIIFSAVLAKQHAKALSQGIPKSDRVVFRIIRGIAYFLPFWIGGPYLAKVILAWLESTHDGLAFGIIGVVWGFGFFWAWSLDRVMRNLYGPGHPGPAQ